MTKYRKKPVVIEAFKFGSDPAPLWWKDAVDAGGAECVGDGRIATVQTLEGNMRVSDGDYIIKGIKDEIYPCKPDIFEATYEAVE